MNTEPTEKTIVNFFKLLEPDYPEWLTEYVAIPELQSQHFISTTCGTIYSDLFPSSFFVSSLDHGIATGLIVWHFTHDKKQTLAGLYHDIATPVFKHCIDFLDGDYETQESTEDLTRTILENSKELQPLLERDHITIDEIADYHLYPIADNDSPQLSADRLGYTLSDSIFTYELATIDEAREIYNDIMVGSNEQGETELIFKTKSLAERFVELSCKLSILYREDRTRYSMQFVADIIKRLNRAGIVTREDLYKMKETDVLELIKKSDYAKQFEIWQKSKQVKISDTAPKDKYYVHCPSKVRYINPLIKNHRASEVSATAKHYIDNNLAYKMDKYVYLDLQLN